MKDTLDRSIAPEVRPLPRLILPQWETSYLPCGIRVVKLTESHCSAPVYSVRAVVSGAGVMSTPHHIAASILPFVLSHGADSLDTNAVNEIIEGAGAFVRPKTSNCCLDIELRGLCETARDAMEVFAAMLAKPRFEAESFDAYREMMAEGLDVKSMESGFIASREASLRYWGKDHPFLDNPTAEQMRSLRREEVVELHRLTFRPEHITLYVSGDVTPRLMEVISDAMGRYFPGIATHSDAPVPQAGAPALESGDYNIKGINDEQAAIRILRPSIKRSHPDYCMLRMAVTGLGGYFGSRLIRRIREDLGLTYGIGASLASDRIDSSIVISTKCMRDRAAEALGEIRAEIDRFVAEPPRGEELESLRGFLITGLTDSFNTPMNILDWATIFQILGTDRSYFERNQDAIFGATPDDLARVVAQYLLPAPEIAVTVS